jgi:prepilin-type N-terminal cleavage/methylation domain-containing protein
MPASPAISRSHRRGFTLVEVLVAMSVLSALVLLYGSIFNGASKAWIAGGGNTERRRNARALTDYIANEMKGALLPVETLSNSGKGNLQFMINPPSGQVPGDYKFADTVFWQAPLATEATFGDIAEVGYFVKWDTSAANDPRPQLCRFFVNPSSTETSGTIVPNPNYLIFDQSPTRWLSGSLIDAVAPATKASGYLGLFGENVIGFWIRSYGLDGQELPRSFDSRTGYDCQFKSTSPSGIKQTWTEKRYLPARVQVSIAQVDSHYAPRLGLGASRLRQIVQAPDIHDATEFLAKFRQDATSSAVLAPLLPGVRIYSTEVQLSNAR